MIDRRSQEVNVDIEQEDVCVCVCVRKEEERIINRVLESALPPIHSLVSPALIYWCTVSEFG
jgi:hypothetical protein